MENKTMDNFLASINDSDVERNEDRAGGFHRLDSDIYKAVIKTAYLGSSTGGAHSITFIFDISGQEYRETLFFTNREGKIYYLNQNKKKVQLPGYSIFKNIAVITCGKEPNKLVPEEKVIKLWDFETSSDQLKSVPVITEFSGKEVALGIIKELVNKRKKNESGNYVEVPEYNEVNRITAVFHPEKKLTVNEAMDHKEPKFWDDWLKANQGKVKDNRKIKDDSPFSSGSTDTAPKTNYKSVFDN